MFPPSKAEPACDVECIGVCEDVLGVAEWFALPPLEEVRLMAPLGVERPQASSSVEVAATRRRERPPVEVIA